MSSTLHVPDELARKLAAAAAARGTTADELATELLRGHVLDAPSEQPKLAFVGIGASGDGISHQIDELLADGFGQS
ncbi:MAG: hypothetical protein R8G01_19810 [Ilumatobacteraceae bacterium]|nr:hypothetical protein [Ilumatobacteraceae bacterium]